MAKKSRAARPNIRKAKTLREALAVLHTADEHIREDIKEYRAHKLPKPIAGDDDVESAGERGQRVLRLAILRRLRQFTNAVKAYDSAGSKKSIGWHLGLERGPGHPRGRKSGRSLDTARKISEQRETRSETRKTKQGKPARTMWKEVGSDHGISEQAARIRVKRALPYLAEEEAKEFVARLKQHSKQKPRPIGKAKARSAAIGKEITAHNRRKR
jgi:hypothetical protein